VELTILTKMRHQARSYGLLLNICLSC